MKSYMLILIALFIATISGCAKHRGQPGPKLYDNVYIVIKSDSAMVQQQSSDKQYKDLKQSADLEMLSIVHKRLREFTEDELLSKGDLKPVSACQPRTLKIVQDVLSISVQSKTSYKQGWGGASRITVDDVHVTTSTTIEDCESGNRYEKATYENSGADLIAVVRTLASWNVSATYKYQRAFR